MELHRFIYDQFRTMLAGIEYEIYNRQFRDGDTIEVNFRHNGKIWSLKKNITFEGDLKNTIQGLHPCGCESSEHTFRCKMYEHQDMRIP
jgi:hypothetical protein